MTSDGMVLGVGRNRRVQSGSAIRHGEVCLPCLDIYHPALIRNRQIV